MKKMIKLNLKMFEGEGGADVAPAAEAEGTEVQAEETETEAEGQEEEQQEPESRETAYQKFRNDYKDLIGKDIEKAVSRRYTENQQLHKQLESFGPLMDLLGARYGVKSGKAEDVMAAIEKDNSFFEEAALKAGLPVEQYKNMLKLEAQNRSLLEEQQRTNEEIQRQQKFARWDRERERCEQLFPGFDMHTEAQNPQFLTLLDSGCSMETAYKAIHFEELNQGTMRRTEMETQKKVADTIRAGATRPTESGAKKNSATQTKIDVANMTYEQMDAMIERARNGESVTFS